MAKKKIKKQFLNIKNIYYTLPACTAACTACTVCTATEQSMKNYSKEERIHSLISYLNLLCPS